MMSAQERNRSQQLDPVLEAAAAGQAWQVTRAQVLHPRAASPLAMPRSLPRPRQQSPPPESFATGSYFSSVLRAVKVLGDCEGYEALPGSSTTGVVSGRRRTEIFRP